MQSLIILQIEQKESPKFMFKYLKPWMKDNGI